MSIGSSAHCYQAAVLVETVGVDDGIDAVGLSHCDNQLGRYGRFTRCCFFERRDSEGVPIWMHQDTLKEGGRPRHHTDLMCTYSLEYRRNIEYGHWVDRCTAKQGGEPASLVAEAVKERIDNEVVVGLV